MRPTTITTTKEDALFFGQKKKEKYVSTVRLFLKSYVTVSGTNAGFLAN